MLRVQDGFIHIVLGITWWLTRYASDNPDMKKWVLAHLATRVIVSAFAGFMMYNLVMIMGQETFAVIASWIGGFMGVWALELLSNFLKKKVWP